MTTRIEQSAEAAVARIVFCPEPETKPPTFDLQSLRSLEEAICDVEKAGSAIRAVVISSKSEKHFLVGANISALQALTANSIGDWVREGHRVFNRLQNLPVPVIALVNGNALGGGLEVALACDFLLATPQARFGFPEPRLGLMTGWGGAYRLSRRVKIGVARELLYTGRLISSAEAREIGICDVLGSLEDLHAWIEQFIGSLQDLAWSSIAETKFQLLRIEEPNLELARELEAEASCRLLKSPETLARLRDFFADRAHR